MSFQDVETGLAHPSRAPSSSIPQSREDSAFIGLQSSLSLQVFKINSNVQGVFKLVDQLGTTKDSATLRKSLWVPPIQFAHLWPPVALTPRVANTDMISPNRHEPWQSGALRI